MTDPLEEPLVGWMTATSASRILEAFACGRSGCLCVRSSHYGKGLTHCPSHSDETPSLDVKVHGDKVLIHCHAGCIQNAVIKALQDRGLWPKWGEGGAYSGTTTVVLTEVYPLYDQTGAFIAAHHREDLSDGKKRMWWTRNGKLGLNGLKVADLPLYGYLDVLAAIPPSTVVVVEGEKARDALKDVGILAVGTVTGAPGKPSLDSLRPLKGHEVYLWPDNDKGGEGHMAKVGDNLRKLGVTPRYIRWHDAPPKGDAVDFLKKGGTAEGVQHLKDVARSGPYKPVQEDSITTESGRHQIIVTNRHLRDLAQETWDVARAVNDPPFLFQRGHLLVDIIKEDTGQPTLRTLDKPALKGILDRIADFLKEVEDGLKPARPPADVVADMMAAKELPLPYLNGIIESPIFTPEGVLKLEPGYQPETGYYLHMTSGIHIPLVVKSPTLSDITHARDLLTGDLLVDFPFVGDADLAHAIAALLLPFVRLLINGPTPLHLLESPTPGSGKGLLGNVLTIPAGGRSPAVMSEG